MRRLWVGAVVSALMVGAYLVGTMQPAGLLLAQSGDQQCFQETGKCARGAFLAYWRSHGGLEQQGFPISDEMQEQQAPPPAGDGKVHTVQYFERARFELHEELGGQVLLGLLGSEQYKAKYQTPPPQAPQVNTGNGDTNTALFTLRGGHYEVFSAGSSGRPSCVLYARLKSEDQRFSESINSDALTPGQARSTHLYHVPAGRFYLSVISSCTWRIEIHERRE